jgi:glycosyltransferase involved in cell wall biosynthesis
VTWLARDAGEQADIAREFPRAAPAVVVPCLGPLKERDAVPAIEKVPGAVTLLFLSRITAKKNLAFLLEVLRTYTGGGIDLDIVGPIEDEPYWARCQELIEKLPASVRVRYRGECPPGEVPGWLARTHAMVLPTLGENYGYVVAEALEAGRPVMISDQTPWDGLQADRAGWTLPLSADAWITEIERLRQMPSDEYQAWCLGARARGVGSRRDDSTEAATLDVLRQAAETRAR